MNDKERQEMLSNFDDENINNIMEMLYKRINQENPDNDDPLSTGEVFYCFTEV